MSNRITFPNLGIDITVNRVAFSLFGINIYFYALIITVGIILAYLYGIYEGKRQGIDPDVFSDLLIIGIPSSIIAARIYYVAAKWDYYSKNLSEIINLRAGGIAIYGAIIGALVSAVLYCKKKKISFFKIIDICSVGLLMGQALGRWGNFFNAEAYGYETDSFLKMGIFSEEANKFIYVHPTFLYESIWNFAGVIILMLLMRRKKKDGQVFWTYVFWYGLGRFFIEGLRADSLMAGSIRISQLVAAVSVIIGSGFMLYYYISARKNK